MSLKFLSVKLKGRLDHFIRHKISKRGITVLQNTYTGFDSEFELEDEVKFFNRLIFFQMAIQRRTIVKVPSFIYIGRTLAMSSLTSEISEFYKPGVIDDKDHLYTFTENVEDNLCELIGGW